MTALTAPGDPTLWERLDDALHGHRRILLTTHINPDGDGVGSQIALGSYLASLGKEVTILNASPVPKALRFALVDHLRFECYDESQHRQTVLTSDAIVILDTAEWSRLGPIAETIRAAHGQLLVIDHHICNNDIGDVFLSVPTASSTGELIYHLLKRRLSALPIEIARALCVAIGTDTGWFRFSNTNADVLRIAAELSDCGVELQQVYGEVYETTTWKDVALYRELVASLRPECDGRVALIHLPKESYDRHRGDDLDRILDYALTIPTVEVVLFFKQVATTATKLSLRSRGGLDIGALARKHGGGGHRNASGVLAQVVPSVLEARILEDVRHLFERPEQPSG